MGVVHDDRRYHHPDVYLQGLTARHAFRVAVLEPAVTRLDRGTPVAGRVCVLIKT